ncbi:MAG: hypothetical protein QQN60_07580, partial [Nitrosopumilus sp.]
KEGTLLEMVFKIEIKLGRSNGQFNQRKTEKVQNVLMTLCHGKLWNSEITHLVLRPVETDG